MLKRKSTNENFQLVEAISKMAGIEGKACFLFTSKRAVDECRAFALSPLRGETVAKEEELTIRVFDIHVRVYAIFFPPEKMEPVYNYWTNAGLGISSRLAEDALSNISLLKEVTDDSPTPKLVASPAHLVIKERIAALLERAPVGPPRHRKVSPEDVYFFPSGMGAIYRIHKLLLGKYQSSAVLFGFSFHSTIHVFKDFEIGHKFLGLGTSSDVDALQTYLETEAAEGRRVGAVFAEFPSNPNIVTPDLVRIRKLADQYHFVLVVDDTIASFCNVDLLGVADILLTSLTKSFCGYADVIAGSAVLNPSSPLYEELKEALGNEYIDEFYNGDAVALEKNSRDYLQRSEVFNRNAQVATEYLQSLALDPKSSVTKVMYQPVSPELENYKPFMRPK